MLETLNENQRFPKLQSLYRTFNLDLSAHPRVYGIVYDYVPHTHNAAAIVAKQRARHCVADWRSLSDLIEWIVYP